nr:hypothetical protein FFPRI1PSEUD_23230 [Pseudomonas sp. FFPRI_1]
MCKKFLTHQDHKCQNTPSIPGIPHNRQVRQRSQAKSRTASRTIERTAESQAPEDMENERR